MVQQNPNRADKQPTMVVETFEQIPERIVAGRRGRKSELLDAIRNLEPGQNLKIAITDSDFKAGAHRTAQRVYSKGALDWKPKVLTFPAEGVIRIYRQIGSDYAYDQDGNPIVNPNNGFRMTEAEVEAENPTPQPQPQREKAPTRGTSRGRSRQTA